MSIKDNFFQAVRELMGEKPEPQIKPNNTEIENLKRATMTDSLTSEMGKVSTFLEGNSVRPKTASVSADGLSGNASVETAKIDTGDFAIFAGAGDTDDDTVGGVIGADAAYAGNGDTAEIPPEADIDEVIDFSRIKKSSASAYADPPSETIPLPRDPAPSVTIPSRAEPSRTEPSRTEPSRTNPSRPPAHAVTPSDIAATTAAARYADVTTTPSTPPARSRASAYAVADTTEPTPTPATAPAPATAHTTAAVSAYAPKPAASSLLSSVIAAESRPFPSSGTDGYGYEQYRKPAAPVDPLQTAEVMQNPSFGSRNFQPAQAQSPANRVVPLNNRNVQFAGGTGISGYSNAAYGGGSIGGGNRGRASDYADANELTIISTNTRVEGNIRSFANMAVAGEIKGDVETTKNVDLNGTVVGNISCNNGELHQAKVQGNIRMKGNALIERDTLLLGDLTSTYAEINGKVRGNVNTAGRAEFKCDSVIMGDVSASTFTVEDGAIMHGFVSTTFISKEESHNLFPETIIIGEV